ncbi:hypothetical protein AMECASPLE_029211 [Ameca splendens]|uniref:Uncharacterized protein n=1 Tax=Ameca splendens TaxID=208324 RepID=A0ABV0ZFT6_9TELE
MSVNRNIMKEFISKFNLKSQTRVIKIHYTHRVRSLITNFSHSRLVPENSGNNAFICLSMRSQVCLFLHTVIPGPNLPFNSMILHQLCQQQALFLCPVRFSPPSFLHFVLVILSNQTSVYKKAVTVKC